MGDPMVSWGTRRAAMMHPKGEPTDRMDRAAARAGNPREHDHPASGLRGGKTGRHLVTRAIVPPTGPRGLPGKPDSPEPIGG
jgi:hypothetical protein